MMFERAFLIVTVTFVASWTLGCDDHSKHTASAEEGATAATAEGEGPIAVEVSARGYTPNKVAARAGQPLTLVFTRTTDQGCGEKLAIPSQNIERDLPLNQPVEVTFTPETTGEVAFTCGMGMYDGKVVVQ